MVIDRFSPEFRRAHLGASQVPTAIGVSPFAAPIELWGEYVLGNPGATENDAMRLGKALEGGVADVASEMLGLSALPSATHVHSSETWLVATPDRLLEDGSLLQIKTTALASVTRRADIDEQWGDAGTDEVPLHVVAQCMSEMEVMRSIGHPTERNHVGALIPGRGVVLYLIEWDAALASSILSRARSFWTSVQDRREPAFDDSPAWSEHMRRKYPQHVPGRWVDADPGMHFVINTYLQAADMKAQAERAMAIGETIIKNAIGPAEGIKCGDVRIPWRTARAPMDIDWQAAHAEMKAVLGGDVFHEIVDRHTRITTETTRRFGPARKP